MEAWTGFFGKMPATGDFIGRGLPAGLRQPLDHWLTACLAGIAPQDWPPDGIRARMALGGRTVLVSAVPSEDRLGRLFPLVALRPGADVPREAADRWCTAVLYDLADAADGLIGPDELGARLAAAPAPETGADEASDIVWRSGGPVAPATREGVAALISSG